MNILLGPETQRLLEDRMRRNGLSNPEDAVRVALEALDRIEAEDLDDDTLVAIEEGLAQANRGEGRPWEDVRSELQARFLAT